MTTLRFLVDMNISPKTVADLHQQGWDILRVLQVVPMDTEDSEICIGQHDGIQHLHVEALVSVVSKT